jgi:ribosomal protein S18 acetylase RimI-like enzyme
MLRPATVVDFPILRALIREGAASGSFDREFATDSREASLFFSNLRQALATGYFVEEDPKTGDLLTRAAPGFIYVADSDATAHRPIGFGLFKAAPVGYELWLAGIDAAWRGHHHGRAMLDALLKTSPGRTAYVVRVKTYGGESPAMAHLLESFGFVSLRESPQHTWFVRKDAPEEIRKGLSEPTKLKAAS